MASPYHKIATFQGKASNVPSSDTSTSRLQQEVTVVENDSWLFTENDQNKTWLVNIMNQTSKQSYNVSKNTVLLKIDYIYNNIMNSSIQD